MTEQDQYVKIKYMQSPNEKIYQNIKNYIVYGSASLYIIRTLVVGLHSASTFATLIPIGLALLSLGALLIEKSPTKYKIAYLILICELNSMYHYWFYQALNSNLKDTLSLMIIISNLVIELKVINKPWIAVAMQSKFVMIWLLNKDFSSRLEIEHHTVSFVCLLWGTMIATITETSIHKLISNLHQDHLKLAKAMRTLNTIISSLPEALIIIGYDLTIFYKNDVSLQLFECGSSQALIEILNSLRYKSGLRVYDADISNENVMRDFQDYILSDRPQKMAFGIAPFKDKYINIHGSKVDWDNQQAVILSARDITSQIIADEYKTELVWKNMVLRSVSHEIRTPTTAIITFSEQIMKDESHLSPEAKKYMKTVSVCSKMLLNLVNDLLDYSQILAGTFKVSKKLFELRPVLNETFNLLTMQCEKKGIEFKLTIDDLIPNKIYSDPNRLSQIILNLLTNALKFTFKGRICIGCYHSIENKLRVIVSDTGIGIPADKISKLFTEFGKIDFSNRNPQGCGLGLNISNMLVKLLGGDKIDVSSEEGKGSVFSFQVDIREDDNYMKGLVDDPDYEEIIESRSMRNVREMNVSGSYNRDYPSLLIVDDMEFMREIMELYLTNAHIPFDIAISGQEALSKVIYRDRIGIQYSLIVMDCEMPDIDGYTVSRKINELHANNRLSRMPYIIAHTAHSGADDRTRCLNAGMLDYLVKPCKENEFVSKILSILP